MNDLCPNCGGRLQHITYTVDPPIPGVVCYSCGYRAEGKQHFPDPETFNLPEGWTVISKGRPVEEV